MKAVWLDTENDPYWEKLAQHQITWVYVPLSDPPHDVRRRLLEIKARGLRAGVYAAWNWYPDLNGAELAAEVDQQLKAVAPDATAGWPKVQLDDETHSSARILSLLRAWRMLRPNTDTSWTFESFQGGWMDSAFVAGVTACKVRLAPQCYIGTMQAVDALAAARDLTRRGFPDGLISPMYDAAQLPVGWDGWAFTQGRLP